MNKFNKQEKTKELFNKLIDGVTSIIDSGEYNKFLRFSKNFHNYSFNNILLIYLQMKNATKVAGFKTWQSMGRKVKAGEKGIQIIYPIKRSFTKINKKQDANEELEEKKIVEYYLYRPTYVFDVSQTEGDPLPLESRNLNTNNKQELFDLLCSFSRFPIKEMELFGDTKGYWHPKKKYIVLEKRLSIDDKVTVLIHELTHALYDDFDYSENRNLSETFVESVAFVVADYFGLDNSNYSFNYITYWAKGNEKEFLSLGDKIQKTANEFIKSLEEFANNKIERKVC